MPYLQERQDFIASVAMCQVPYFSPIPFKEAIFDCLNPDYISKRHPNTPQITNFLLDNIARSEGYTRYGEQKLRVSYYERKENKEDLFKFNFDNTHNYGPISPCLSTIKLFDLSQCDKDIINNCEDILLNQIVS